MHKEISDAEFSNEVEDKKGLAVVDFWAPWCPPCRMMAPIFEEISNKYQNIRFFKINTEENPEKASQLGVSSIPCIIFFKDGKEISRQIGFQSESAFEESVKKLSE